MKKILYIIFTLLDLFGLTYFGTAQTIPFTSIQKAAPVGAGSVVVTNTAGVLTYTTGFPVSKWTNDVGYVTNSAVTTSLSAYQLLLNGTGFVKATGTVISYDNSTYLTTSSAAGLYVPYSAWTGSVNGGANTFSISGLAYLGTTNVTGSLTNFGTALTWTNTSATFTNNITLRSYSTFTDIPAIYVAVSPNNQTGTNYAILGDGSNNVFNAPNGWFARTNNTTFLQASTTSTTSGEYIIMGKLTSTLAANAALSGFRHEGNTLVWNVGTTTTMRERYFSNATYSALTTATITDASGLDVTQATIGTGMTITRNWAARFTGAVAMSSSLIIGATTTSPSANFHVIGTGSVSLGITTPTIYGSSASGGTLNIFSTSDATKGLIQIGSTGSINIGAGTFGGSALHLVRISKGTSTIDIGEQAAGEASMWFNQNTPSTTNYNFRKSGSLFIIGDPTRVQIRASDNAHIDVNRGSIIFSNESSQIAAATPEFLFTTTLNGTGFTASTNVPSFKIAGSSKLWLAGAITNQYFNYFTDNTATFASASTISDAYNTYIESVVAGTNATLTRKYSLGTTDNVAFGIGNTSASLYLGVAPSTTNWMLSNAAGAGSTYLNAPASGFIVLSVGTANRMQLNNGNITFNPGVTNGGSTPAFQFTNPNNTSRTLSTEIPGFKYVGGTQQWAAGAITTQRDFYLSTTTYGFVSASTVSDGYGFYVEKPTAGTNATITRAWGIGTDGNITATGYGVGATPSTSRPFNASSTVSGEYSYFITNLSTGASAQAAIRLGNNSNQSVIGQAGSGATTGNGLYPLSLNFTQSDPGGFSFGQQGNASSGAYTRFRIWGTGNYTNQTTATEIPGFKTESFTRGWATGNITDQRENYFASVTYSAVGASVFTNVYGLYVDAPTISTNVTATNLFAAGFNGSVNLLDGFGLAFGTTNGGKIGLSSSQKIGFWNTTPIVQPTTAFAGATYVSVGGSAMSTNDTYDGYTILQVVKALRTIGILQ